MVSPTAMTISRMALRVSTGPEGPPVPMAYFLSLRRRPPPGLVRPLLWVDRGRFLTTSNERSSRTQGYGEASPMSGEIPVAYQSRDQTITEAIEAGVDQDDRGDRGSGTDR